TCALPIYVVLNAQEHQSLPFERLVEELRPERNLNHTTLFQVAFALDNTSAGAAEPPGIKLSRLSASYGMAKFDLTLNILELRKRIAANFEYSTELFDNETIVRLASHFKNLLKGVV